MLAQHRLLAIALLAMGCTFGVDAVEVRREASIDAAGITLLREDISRVHAVHLTGHGWRKLMRLDAPFVYRITDPGQPLPIFDFLRTHGVSQDEAWATFNMGVGFVLYVAPDAVERTLAIARDRGYRAWVGGRVERDGDRKAVEIPPLDLTFDAASLQVR